MDPTISGIRPDDLWSRRRDEEQSVHFTAPAIVARANSLQASPEPGASAPQPGVPLAAIAPPSPRNARDVQVQRGMDAFYMSLTGWYHTPASGNGGSDRPVRDVAVATPFMMRPGYTSQRVFLANPENRAAMTKVAARAGLSEGALGRVQSGRGTPEEIHRLTQALIDVQPAGKVWSPGNVRELMFNHAIGIDCAGYVQQAYLSGTGRTAPQAGFQSVTLESLAGLAQRGYTRIDALAAVRPGDIIVLGPPREDPGEPGHRAIVYDQRLATADDLRTLLTCPQGQAFAVGGSVRVVEMDSSFGSSGRFEEGGVQRQTWLHNEATGKWALEILDGAQVALVVRPTLYGHPLEGFYRRGGD